MEDTSAHGEDAARPLLESGMRAHSEGNLLAADRLYAQTLQQQPDNTQALKLRAILARERGDVDFAVRLLQQALQYAAGQADLHAELGLSYLATGQLVAGEHALRAAARLRPEAAATQVNLGAVLQQRGHVRDAIDCYRKALEAEPEDVFTRCNLAKALSDAGDSAAARHECDRAEQQQAHPVVLATRGAVMLDERDYAAARDALTTATASGYPDDMAHVNLALSCSQLGDPRAALAALEAALEINPYNARAVADMANCLDSMDETAAAIRVCERFLAEHPGERLVLGSYALSLHNAGRSDAADSLTNCQTLTRVFDYATVDGFASLTAFNNELRDIVTSDASIMDSPVSKSTTQGAQTGELDMESAPALQALGALFERSLQEAADYYTQNGLADHPVMCGAGEPRVLRTWGTCLGAGGHQSSHMHPLAWLSGVYYVNLPESMQESDSEAGYLEFNTPPERFFCRDQPLATTLQPKPGRLVIFPSWFWHQTRTFSGPGERISIAFDAVPTAALRML